MASEILIFDKEDEGKADGPVTEQADKVADNCRKMVLSNHGKNPNDKRNQEGPNEARYGVEKMTKQLDR